MPFAAALSEHPVTAHAVGEAAGQVLERLGAAPDLAVAFVTPHHAGALEDVVGVLRAVLDPDVALGCAAVGVAGDGREVEDGPAVSVWAGTVGPVAPVHLVVEPTEDGRAALVGLPADLDFTPTALLLLGDPWTFPIEAVLDVLAEAHPDLPVIGGMASAPKGPGGSVLNLDGRPVSSGAVGALLGPGVVVDPVVSQGCRPIGPPWTVTAADGGLVLELGGKPPIERLNDVAGELSDAELQRLRTGLHIGLVVDERALDPSPSDLLAKVVVGGDRERGGLRIGGDVEVGTTAQFLVRDAESADAELRSVLAGRDADAALLFTCNGRGRRFFGAPDHDAGVIDAVLDGVPLAGMFSAGEVGPVGGRSRLHSYTASVALVTERRA